MIKKIFKIIGIILVIILLPFCTYCSIIFFRLNSDRSLEYAPYTERDVEYALNQLYDIYEYKPLSNRVYRNMLDEEFCLKVYFYQVIDLPDEINGWSNCWTRTIKIDKQIQGYSYCKTLCHEMIHIKYCTGDETFTSYMTFVTLYESDNIHLKQVGAWFGIDQIDKCYRGEYNCRDYIIKYFKEKA